jgi:uncharacterized damage-inducible protein DinB
MPENAIPLIDVFRGWDGYNRSLVNAIAPRTPEELRFRTAPGLRSVGEIAAHIALGRVDWLRRIDAPSSDELAETIEAWRKADPDAEAKMAQNAAQIVEWLDVTWSMVERMLVEWTVADLARTYRHTYWGKVYEISYQWTIWRVMAHDIHHGGQLCEMLYMQGISLPDLGDNGGHIIAPPVVGEE